MTNIVWLDSHTEFPPAHTALTDPEGLLAAGGDLSVTRLLSAYRRGIFPWFNEDQPILWWCPNPRCVIFPQNIHISRSMKRMLRKSPYTFTLNQRFDEVMALCGKTREQSGTWITPAMHSAYCELAASGYAKSLEVWYEGKLVGGIYGVTIGRMFFGESMFSLRVNASKAAIIALALQLHTWNYALMDCQVPNPHLFSLGAQNIPRQEFLSILSNNIDQKIADTAWISPTLDDSVNQYLMA